MKPVKLYWYGHHDPVDINFGDFLNPLLVEMVSGRPVEYTPIDQCDMIAIGSIVELAVQSTRVDPIYLWGTGLIREGPIIEDARLHCTALRGHMTAQKIKGAGGVPLGDAGLLCNMLIDRLHLKKYPLGIVAHYIDLDLPIVNAYRQDSRYRVISPLLPVREFIRNVAECEVILSSSLHGIITADALGIPNCWLKLSDKVVGNGYKFSDYLSVFGLEDTAPLNLPLPDQVSDGLLENIASGYARPGLEEIQRQLIASFPPV